MRTLALGVLLVLSFDLGLLLAPIAVVFGTWRKRERFAKGGGAPRRGALSIIRSLARDSTWTGRQWTEYLLSKVPKAK